MYLLWVFIEVNERAVSLTPWQEYHVSLDGLVVSEEGRDHDEEHDEDQDAEDDYCAWRPE